MNDPTNWSSPYSLSFPGVGSFFGLTYSHNEAGADIGYMQAMQSAAVHACVKCLSEDVAKLPLHLRKRLLPVRGMPGGSTIVTGHPLTRLIRQPNDYQTPFEFWQNMVWSHQLRGNAYSYIKRGRDGTAKQLMYLHPDRVQVSWMNSGRIYYNFTHPFINKGSQKQCTAEDMLHIRNMSVNGGFVGQSPIQLCQTVIGIDMQTRNHAAKVFKQGTSLSGVLTHPGKINPTSMNNMRDSWQHAFGGTQNAMKVAFLQEGVQYQPLGMTNADAQLLEARQFNVVEIARIFRVPLHKIGDLSRATFSNIEDQNQSYIDDALMGIVKRIEEALEIRLLRSDEFDDYEFRFDFEQLLRGNSLVRAQTNQIRKANGVISANEWRTSDGLAPSDDPAADELKVNQNLAGKPDVGGNVPKDEQ